MSIVNRAGSELLEPDTIAPLPASSRPLHFQFEMPTYEYVCEKCGQEIQAESFLWRKGENAPYARIYTCPHCDDSGEHAVTREDIDRAKRIASTDNLHRSRAFERVIQLEDEDRVYAEEAIEYYLPRPLYLLTTIINRLDSLNLTPERRVRLNA